MNNEKQLKSSDLRLFLQDLEGDEGFRADNFLALIADTDETTALRILARFTDTLSEIRHTFELALLDNDFETVWMYCHKVSSSAELLGFVSYSDKAKQLGSDLKNVNLEDEKKRAGIKLLAHESHHLKTRIAISCQSIKYYR